MVCHRDLSHFLSNLCWNFFSGRQSSFEENKHPSPLHTWILIFVVALSSACSLTVHGIFDSLSANFVLVTSDRACPAVRSVENWLCEIWRLLKTTAVKRLLPYSFTQYYTVFSSVKSSVSLPAFCPLISRFTNFTQLCSSCVVLSYLWFYMMDYHTETIYAIMFSTKMVPRWTGNLLWYLAPGPQIP